MFWRILAVIGAITFLVGGVNLATNADEKCSRVTWDRSGPARFSTFTYSCWSEREWANRHKYEYVDSSGNITPAPKDGGMSGASAAWLSFGGAFLLLSLATWPLILVPPALVIGAIANRNTSRTIDDETRKNPRSDRCRRL
jgi:hypothetical protein